MSDEAIRAHMRAWQRGEETHLGEDPEAEAAEMRGRECGCRWHTASTYEAEFAERLIMPGPDRRMVVFERRCPQHAEMCRAMEDWEFELLEEHPQ